MVFIKKLLKSSICIIIFLCITLPFFTVRAAETELQLDCASAVLMEASTGKVLYEKEADTPLPPASVTKIMTILLTMEAIDNGNLSLTDSIQVSETAASMGGSQVFLKVGETMTAEDMLKSVVVASANDAAVALAEHLAGSVEGFVSKMNARADELGMKNTNFENATGLDDNTVNHVTSARDIAIMSRELLKHDKILNYSTIWMDTIRNGEFGLTNTNRLIRFYNGANGLKTGSTSKAKFCISATAKRDGMQLIAVIMASPTRDVRNECAKKLLDYGFANYSIATFDAGTIDDIRVLGGVKSSCTLIYPETSVLVGKGQGKNIEKHMNIPETLSAPLHAGDKVGEVVYTLNGNEISKSDIRISETVEKISYFGLLGNIFKKYLLMG